MGVYLNLSALRARSFQTAKETFSSVWNMGNCQYITLKKKEKKLGEKDPHEYELHGPRSFRA